MNQQNQWSCETITRRVWWQVQFWTVSIKWQAVMYFLWRQENIKLHDPCLVCTLHILRILLADSLSVYTLCADSTETDWAWLCFPVWYGRTGDLLLGRERLPGALNIHSTISSVCSPRITACSNYPLLLLSAQRKSLVSCICLLVPSDSMIKLINRLVKLFTCVDSDCTLCGKATFVGGGSTGLKCNKTSMYHWIVESLADKISLHNAAIKFQLDCPKSRSPWCRRYRALMFGTVWQRWDIIALLHILHSINRGNHNSSNEQLHRASLTRSSSKQQRI